MLFDFTEKLASNVLNSVGNTLSIADSLLNLEAPKREQVVRLLADGIEIAAISEATGVAVEIIEAIKDE